MFMITMAVLQITYGVSVEVRNVYSYIHFAFCIFLKIQMVLITQQTFNFMCEDNIRSGFGIYSLIFIIFKF